MNSESPVIIIGAARSGTNMLRDLLSSLDPFATWPCDEINYIWRHGNREFESDEFTRDMADEKTAKFIRKQFEKFSSQHPSKVVVEKTCANTLRCEFVDAVIPNAKFVQIIRDGRDVAASASIRWNAGLDVGYLMKKAKYVPLSDIPYYAFRYLGSHVYRLTAKENRLSTWGPKFSGMQDVFESNDLAVGCATQWKACVKKAQTQLGAIDPSRVLTVRYEDVTAEPAKWIGKVCEFAGVEVDKDAIEKLTSNVSTKSVGKWQKQFSTEQVDLINEHVGDLLQQLGYSGS